MDDIAGSQGMASIMSGDGELSERLDDACIYCRQADIIAEYGEQVLDLAFPLPREPLS